MIVTGANSYADIESLDGQPLTFGANESVALNAEVLGQSTPDATDSAVNGGGNEFDRIVTALNEGGDLDALLEETAAGAGSAGGGAGGGPTFVRLLRITEGVAPLAYEFGAERVDVIDYPINGGDSDNNNLAAAPDVPDVPGGPGVPEIPCTPVPPPNHGVDLSVPYTGRGYPSDPSYDLFVKEGGEKIGDTGSFKIDTPDGLGSLTIYNTTHSGAAILAASSTNPIEFPTPRGTLYITGYDQESGEVSWRYVPTNADHTEDSWDHSAEPKFGDNIIDDFPVTVTPDFDTFEAQF